MPTIYRQKAPSRLTETQREAKLTADSEYEIAVQNLSADFYRKKHAEGVTAQEETDYKTQKAQLWDNYYNWAVSGGLYEEVTLDQQLKEAEDTLNVQVEEVNAIRTELQRPLVSVREETEVR